MEVKTNSSRAVKLRLICIALIFLMNPNVYIVDILPDFIGYLLIIRAISDASCLTPHFKEAKSAFTKLFYINLSRILALLIIGGRNYADYDIYALFSISYFILETIFVIPAFKELYDAFFYLGERYDAAPAIKPYPYGKKGALHPEKLPVATFIFLTAKNLIAVIPELFRLTGPDTTLDSGYVAGMRRFYSPVLVLCVIVCLVWGIIWLRRTWAYFSNLERDGSVDRVVIGLISEKYSYFEKKIMVRRLRFALMFAIAGFFFAIDFTLDGINVLPDVISAMFLLISFLLLSRYLGSARLGKTAVAVYIPLTLAAYVLHVVFISKYTYYDIVRDSDLSSGARRLYTAVEVLSVFEFIAFVFLMLALLRMLIEFSRRYTGIDPHSERYNSMDAEFHRAEKRSAIIFTVIGILSALAWLVYIFLNASMITTLKDDRVPSGSTILTQRIEWFWMVPFILSIILAVYAAVYFKKLWTEAAYKYTDEYDEEEPRISEE